MDTIEAIKSRISTRVYHDEKLDEETLNKARSAIALEKPFTLDSKHKMILVEDQELSKSLFMGIMGNYGKIVSAGCCIAGITDDARESWISVGFAQEIAVIELTKLGLSTCWVGGFFHKSKVKEVFGAKENEVVPNLISIGHTKPHFINTSIRSLVKGNRRKPKEEIAFHNEWGNNCLNFLESNKDIDLAVQMSILSPSASNRQPVRVIVSEKTAHFYIVDNNDLYSKMRLLDAGIFMSHFFMTMEHLDLKPETSFEKEYPLCGTGFAYAGSIKI
jgi:nitroreductase